MAQARVTAQQLQEQADDMTRQISNLEASRALASASEPLFELLRQLETAGAVDRGCLLLPGGIEVSIKHRAADDEPVCGTEPIPAEYTIKITHVTRESVRRAACSGTKEVMQ